MPFDTGNYQENERRKVIARQLKEVPYAVQELLLNILNHTGRRSELFQTCITCENWNKDTEQCKLVNQRPPANVIADGCPSYVDFDCIPF